MSMSRKYEKEAKKDGIVEVGSVVDRSFPNIDGVVDFTHISDTSLHLDGYSQKWAGRVYVSPYLEELVYEVLNNPHCNYETCYTNDAFEGYVPKYFSAIIKQLDSATEVDYDVLGSRLMNYLGIPTAFNVRADGNDENEEMSDRAYLISVDFIRENEEFYDLYDIYSGGKFDIDRVLDNGLEKTIRINTTLLKIFLKNNDIYFTDEDLKNYERILANSIVARTILLGDRDFRNANAGVLINRKNKSFRIAPNHDFNFILKYQTISGDGFRILDEYSKLYPKDYNNLIQNFMKLVEKNKYGSSELKWIVEDSVEDVYDQNRAMKILNRNAESISNFVNEETRNQAL